MVTKSVDATDPSAYDYKCAGPVVFVGVCARAGVFVCAVGIGGCEIHTSYHKDENVVCANRTNHEDAQGFESPEELDLEHTTVEKPSDGQTEHNL